MAQISLLLLPEKVQSEPLHHWREKVRDILQLLRPLLQSVEKLAICVQDPRGSERIQHTSTYRRDSRQTTPVVWRTQKDDSECRYVDGV